MEMDLKKNAEGIEQMYIAAHSTTPTNDRCCEGFHLSHLHTWLALNPTSGRIAWWKSRIREVHTLAAEDIGYCFDRTQLPKNGPYIMYTASSVFVFVLSNTPHLHTNVDDWGHR